MDRLTVMEAFVKVAETGSFTKAAQQLGVSSQMVGKYVERLEARLGTRLLQRTTRQQSLTEAGRVFCAQARRIIDEVAAADADILALGKRPRGRLRITVPATFGCHRVVPALRDYLDANPEIHVDLTLNDRVVDLIEEGYDAAIRIAPQPHPSLVVLPLSPYELITCAAPEYLARHGAPATPADLADHACLRYASRSNAPGDTWRFTRDGEEQAYEMTGRVRINDARALVAAAVAGCGIMLGARVALEEKIRAGLLVQVLSDYAGPSRPIALLYPANSRSSPKLRSFVEWAARSFGSPATCKSGADSGE